MLAAGGNPNAQKNGKPITRSNISGWFQIHVITQRRDRIDVEKIQEQFLEKGCFVYKPKSFDGGMKKLCLLPTRNKYNAIALQETNGYIMEWLKKLELERTFIITCIADDTGAGRCLTPIKNPQKLA